MKIDFKSIKKIDNTQALEKLNQKNNSFEDKRVWKPTKNKDGISSNIIRYLPPSHADVLLVEQGRFPEEDLTPIIKLLHHYFKGEKGYFIENSLQTFGEECPVKDHDMPLWVKAKKTNDEALKDVLKTRFPKRTYYCNIYVIKDGTNPENNGKVFLFNPWEKLKTDFMDTASKPKFEGDYAFDIFDLSENGCNLHLNLTYEQRSKNGKDFDSPVFTNVKWSNPVAFLDDDVDAQEAVWKQEHSLLEFLDRSKFKSYDELKAKLCKVLHEDSNFNPLGDSSAGQLADEQPTKAAPTLKSKTATSTLGSADKVDVDNLDDFEKLLNSSGASDDDIPY